MDDTDKEFHIESVSFSNIEAECWYWKDRAEKYYAQIFNYQKDLENSEQARLELFLEVQQKDRLIMQYKNEIMSSSIELKTLKDGLEAKNKELSNIENKLMHVLKEKDTYKSQIRALEQANDALQNENRVLSETVANLEGKLDEAYENIALLETQIEEKYSPHAENSTQTMKTEGGRKFPFIETEQCVTKKVKLIDMKADEEKQQQQSLKVKILNSFRKPKRGPRP